MDRNLPSADGPHSACSFTQVCYLMPSSSPRCAQFPRAQDKVHFYVKLKELRDQMRGLPASRDVQETKYSFDLQLAKGKQGEHARMPQFGPTAMTLRLLRRGRQKDRDQRGAGGSRV